MAFFRRSDANMLRTAYELSAGMLSFIIALVLGWWFGRWLDRQLGTAPWLMVGFSVLGLAAGALNVYRTVSGAMKPPASDSDRPGG
jgi:F0F1-type ATP synthase assembly protein I